MSGDSIRYLAILGFATLVSAGCGDDGGAALPSDANVNVPTFDAASADAGAVTRFVASWTLQGGCAGGDVVELDVANDSDGRVTKNRFPCSAASGTSDHVGAGTFGIDLRVIDTSLENLPDAGLPLPDAGTNPPPPGALVAISDRQVGVASVENADTPVQFTFRTTTATITTNWSFKDGEELETCAIANAVTVDLSYDLIGTGVQRTVQPACGDLSDTAVDLPTGVYEITAKALTGGGGEARPDVLTQVLLYVGNQDQTASVTFSPAAVP